MSKRIIFTGGAGKAGRHVVPYLLDHGYEVLNLDLQVLNHPGVHTLLTDLSDAGRSSTRSPATSAWRDLRTAKAGGLPTRWCTLRPWPAT